MSDGQQISTNPKLETNRLLVLAPLSGPVYKLSEIPDAVFAQKMVGDGLAIDPTEGILRAPISGKVLQLHSAGHAITIGEENALQILLHIGLDTVKLKGQGFKSLVKVGDRVHVGQALIEFDLDFLAMHAASLVSPVIVVEPQEAQLRFFDVVMAEAQKTQLFELVHQSTQQIQTDESEQKLHVSPWLTVADPTGLHARPASMIANAAKKFAGQVQLVKASGGSANAKSVVAIMGLEISNQDQFQFCMHGDNAEEAISELQNLILQLNKSPQQIVSKIHSQAPQASLATPATGQNSHAPSDESETITFQGVSASTGVAFGKVMQLSRQEIQITENASGSFATEEKKLLQALSLAKLQLAELIDKLTVEADAGKAAIFAAHQEFLEDPDLLEIIWNFLEQGKSAGFAWKSAIDKQASRLEALSNELMAARGNDLRDVGQRVLRILAGSKEQISVPYPNTILIAENLTPSDTATLDRDKVVGFCTLTGGATSHVAILARSLDLPALAGVDPRVLRVENGTEVILDADAGILNVQPSADEIAQVIQKQNARAQKHRQDLKNAQLLAVTKDHHRVEVVANIGGVSDAIEAVKMGGEGVGLLRSEFLFLERDTAPSETEQLQIYQQVVNELPEDQALIIRTLDVGGDKPLAYLKLDHEDNPFLGERGIRLSLNHPDLLREQLRAILRVERRGALRVMFPMIAQIDELREAKKILAEEQQKLQVAGVEVGVMIEVPSAALLAETLAPEVDFFSIGTNDLAQYTLAMDRGNPKLAKKIDALHPAVLRLIEMTVKAAHQHQKWVGVCGGLASDLLAVPVLIGLGVDELSVSVPAIPAVKAGVRDVDFIKCQQLAQKCVTAADAHGVRSLVQKFKEEA